VKANEEIRYGLDPGAGSSQRRREHKSISSGPIAGAEKPGPEIPRIARLMALAIRFDGLLRQETVRDYAELARLGKVTRARMTQIMKLLDLAPDIQEQILFLAPLQGLNERKLRGVVTPADWEEQRRLFQKIMARLDVYTSAADPIAR
jgi:hypothetical protein